MNKLLFAVALFATTATVPPAGGGSRGGAFAGLDTLRLVACAPGYPSNTEQAQPTMNDFAAMVSDASGWPAGTLTAEIPSERGSRGESSTRQRHVVGAGATALVSEVRAGAGAHRGGAGGAGVRSATERWSLVASAGAITGPESLAGWELLGLPAYAPSFVRGPALADWGALPDSLSVKFTRRVLAGIRRVAAGEEVAVLLDGPQTAALASFPGAESLEVVATSPPLLAWLVVALGDRVPEPVRQQLVKGLLGVHESASFADVLRNHAATALRSPGR